MYTILMVDDEEDIRRALVDAVDWAELGFTVIGEASNGFEALDFLEKNDVDLLVTDIMMPIMGGVELAKATREARPNVQIVFLSGYDHFELAKKAIQYNILSYILKPITQKQIKTEFANIKVKMDEKFLEILNIDEHIDARKELQHMKRDLLLTNLAQNGLSPWQFKKLFGEAGVGVPFAAEPDHVYAVWVVKGDDNTDLSEDEVKHKRLYNIVKIISQKYLTCECTLYGDAVFVVGYGTRAVLDKYLDILPNDILLSAKRIMNMKIYFGQSNYFDDVFQTSLAYAEAVDAVKVIEKTDEQIIHIGDLVQSPEVFGLREAMHQLEAALLSGDKEGFSTIVSQAFATFAQDDATGFHGCVLEILVILFRTQNMLGEGASEVWGMKTVTFHASKREIHRELLEVSNAIVDSIAGRRQKTGDVLARKAMYIIEAEFSDPEMSLQMLAERLHCSSNYLSGIIKKVVGKSFIDLLVDARMKHAKQLLLTTNTKIREISEECGYANQHYFSYAVKKYFNQSPNMIRKSAQNSRKEPL